MVAAVLALRRRFTLRQPGERFRMLRLEFLWGTGNTISRSAAHEGEGVLGVLRVSSLARPLIRPEWAPEHLVLRWCTQ